jgi:hypothetical protein
MYHSVSGAVTTGAVLVNRGSVVVIRDKFSALAFWDDIRRHDRIMFPYIGEPCRISAMSPAAGAGDAAPSLGMGTRRSLAATTREQSKIVRRANTYLIER